MTNNGVTFWDTEFQKRILKRAGWRSGSTVADGVVWELWMSPHDGRLMSLRQAWEEQKRREGKA